MVDAENWSRRVCWPNPDAVCLEGGCGYCDAHPFRSMREIWDWVRSSAPHLDWSLLYGTQNNFFGREVRDDREVR